MAKFAEETRDFLRSHTHAVLSTFLSSDPAYPFGSLVNYDLHPSGDLVLKTALISEHFKNLTSNGHASLIILEDGGAVNQTNARATFLMDFTRVSEDKVLEVRRSFLNRFPEMIPPEIEPSFCYWRGKVAKVRWIGGFAAIGWISSDNYYSK